MIRKNLIVLISITVLIFGQKVSSKENVIASIDSLKDRKADIENQITVLNKKLESIIAEEERRHFTNSKDNIYSAKVTMDARLKNTPSAVAETVMKIPSGSVLEIQFLSDSDYFKTHFNNRFGYVSSVYFKDLPSDVKRLREENKKQNTILEKQMKLQEKKEESQRKKQEIEKYKEVEKQHRKKIANRWGTVIAEKIFEKKIWIGMTDEMVRESWGEPSDINRTVYSHAVHEQWVYYGGRYLYFQDGVLTSWQD